MEISFPFSSFKLISFDEINESSLSLIMVNLTSSSMFTYELFANLPVVVMTVGNTWLIFAAPIVVSPRTKFVEVSNAVLPMADVITTWVVEAPVNAVFNVPTAFGVVTTDAASVTAEADTVVPGPLPITKSPSVSKTCPMAAVIVTVVVAPLCTTESIALWATTTGVPLSSMVNAAELSNTTPLAHTTTTSVCEPLNVVFKVPVIAPGCVTVAPWAAAANVVVSMVNVYSFWSAVVKVPLPDWLSWVTSTSWASVIPAE